MKLKRLKAALRTNEPQLNAIIFFTALNVFAVMTIKPLNYSALLLAILFWPIIAFCINLVEPIPQDKKNDLNT